MTPYVIGAVVALAAAAVGLAVTSLAASVAWRVLRRRLDRMSPQKRGHLLVALRLLPACAAIAAAAAVSVAFLRLEPANTGETLGVVLPATAVGGAAFFLWRIAAASRAWRQTMRVVASWDAHPLAIESPFPLVAVVGIWRPRLYVSRQVVEVCDRDELDAMFAHERAHITARDNLTRLLFLATPFASPATAHAIELAWTRAAEDAADDAARRDARGALALASALTKVARLAAGHPMPLLHVSAIVNGSSVGDRVRRLLDTPPPATSDERCWRYAWLAAAASVGIACAAAMRPIYDAAEFCVRYLP